jgi:hypothetical protein
MVVDFVVVGAAQCLLFTIIIVIIIISIIVIIITVVYVIIINIAVITKQMSCKTLFFVSFGSFGFFRFGGKKKKKTLNIKSIE